jgi:hypothetical protein
MMSSGLDDDPKTELHVGKGSERAAARATSMLSSIEAAILHVAQIEQTPAPEDTIWERIVDRTRDSLSPSAHLKSPKPPSMTPLPLSAVIEVGSPRYNVGRFTSAQSSSRSPRWDLQRSDTLADSLPSSVLAEGASNMGGSRSAQSPRMSPRWELPKSETPRQPLSALLFSPERASPRKISGRSVYPSVDSAKIDDYKQVERGRPFLRYDNGADIVHSTSVTPRQAQKETPRVSPTSHSWTHTVKHATFSNMQASDQATQTTIAMHRATQTHKRLSDHTVPQDSNDSLLQVELNRLQDTCALHSQRSNHKTKTSPRANQH